MNELISFDLCNNFENTFSYAGILSISLSVASLFINGVDAFQFYDIHALGLTFGSTPVDISIPNAQHSFGMIRLDFL